MNRRNPLLVLTVLVGLAMASCGSGGGNNPPMTGGVSATFTASNTTPGSNSIIMSAGTSSGDTFQIVIRVTDILDFFGTGFRVNFDANSAEFLSFDASASLLQVQAPSVSFNAALDPNDSGIVLVSATLTGQIEGLDTATLATDELIILTFRATSSTGGNTFGFDTMLTRVVTQCPTALGACTDMADATLTWSGGTLTAN